MKCATVLLVLLVCNVGRSNVVGCKLSITTASGTHHPGGTICSGAIIFEDHFNTLNTNVWAHENTLGGGGNGEFQWYNSNKQNSYVENGIFYIRPTLTADQYGEAFLRHGTLDLNAGPPEERCTNAQFDGCRRVGTPSHILNPIKSARVHTISSFSFKYGRVEVRAKLPAGDWLWPAIWLLPKKNVYGSWPANGDIDLMESCGNRHLVDNGRNIGPEQVGHTLRYGPKPELIRSKHFSRNSPPGKGYHLSFHRYQMEWSPHGIKFSVDDVETGTVQVGKGFWDRGHFHGIPNPWRSHTPMAPFDQEFFLILNLAVGGTSYFSDNTSNPGGKPWKNNSPNAATEFWNGRHQWLPTWKLHEHHSKEASLQVDYVKIWAL